MPAAGLEASPGTRCAPPERGEGEDPTVAVGRPGLGPVGRTRGGKAVMESRTEQWVIPEGTDVVAADGDKVGKVIAAEADYLVVEKGFFFPTDYYIPRSAVASYDGDKAY